MATATKDHLVNGGMVYIGPWSKLLRAIPSCSAVIEDPPSISRFHSPFRPVKCQQTWTYGAPDSGELCIYMINWEVRRHSHLFLAFSTMPLSKKTDTWKKIGVRLLCLPERLVSHYLLSQSVESLYITRMCCIQYIAVRDKLSSSGPRNLPSSPLEQWPRRTARPRATIASCT
ncbi:hypothetical protein M426DRAFT_200833 [Hypoxylon sp. CI-4A]|nr:hypothetical protein M426DRAFT_200833 [Hypoxylon sp. CI-4A]